MAPGASVGESVGEVPGEFVARLGPDGLAAGGACAAGGSAALDVVDVNQPLVFVEGVRHSDVGHFGSSPDVETLRWLRFLDGGVLAYRAGLDCDVSMCRSTAAALAKRRSVFGRVVEDVPPNILEFPGPWSESFGGWFQFQRAGSA